MQLYLFHLWLHYTVYYNIHLNEFIYDRYIYTSLKSHTTYNANFKICYIYIYTLK